MMLRRIMLALLVLLLLFLAAAGVVGWINYQRMRDEYDAYRALIQPGIMIAGVDVGGLSPEEAAEQVRSRVANPYFQDFFLAYQDEILVLSPRDALALKIPVDEMVMEAVAASHSYDYWEGFRLWVRGETETLDRQIPLRMDFDKSAAAGYLESAAEAHDVLPTEPMVDVKKLAFLPGSPGWHLDVESAARMVNERVADPNQRHVELPVHIDEPDQSQARIASMLSTLGPLMEKAPTPPSYFTATMPVSTTGGLTGTPLVTYTGELTWTFPQFAGYDGPLTTTHGYFFDPGEPGARFDVEGATRQVEQVLRAGTDEPIAFESEPVEQPPVGADLLVPALEERLARFPGVSSILVKNLDTGELIHESNADYVLAGMSVVKIAILIEVYRHFGGEIDEQTHKELTAMLGSESCNPCANRLLATLGGGSAHAGAQRVTNTMRRLGLANFYLCAPFRVVELWDSEGQVVWAVYVPSQLSTASPVAQTEVPRYDRCVRATPREMANLLEMTFQCTQDKGLLRDTYPGVFTPAACQEMIDIMAANDLRNMLGAGIPAEVKMAHKHGFAGYDVPWGDTRAEVGIIYSPGATYLVSFYIWADTPWLNFGIVQPLYRDVSNMLYNFANPEDPFWPRPQWAPQPEENAEADSA